MALIGGAGTDEDDSKVAVILLSLYVSMEK
jgi:hypothetical protein